MNIATSTIIIFLFIIPGITFRRFYYTEEFSKQYFKQNLFELFTSSIVPSLLIHVFLLTIISWFSYYQLDIRLIGQLLTAKGYPSEAFDNIDLYLKEIIAYQLIAIMTGVLGGYFLQKLVRRGDYDSKFKTLRYRNHWHYIFTGEFFNFPRASFDLLNDSIEAIDFVYVDALVNTSDGSYLYDGILVDYELSHDGGLDNISIKEVQRRKLSDDQKKDYYVIPGHIMIIPYSTIININFSFYKLEEVLDDHEEQTLRPILVS